mmetsp:Transcript_7996/g.21012  ORF Transcript_7996/g.21012 Transcript_7996/m.21012 type:complete len:227 (+) Transcript_7996:650-1330(+)
MSNLTSDVAAFEGEAKTAASAWQPSGPREVPQAGRTARRVGACLHARRVGACHQAPDHAPGKERRPYEARIQESGRIQELGQGACARRRAAEQMSAACRGDAVPEASDDAVPPRVPAPAPAAPALAPAQQLVHSCFHGASWTSWEEPAEVEHTQAGTRALVLHVPQPVVQPADDGAPAAAAAAAATPTVAVEVVAVVVVAAAAAAVAAAVFRTKSLLASEAENSPH